MKTSKQIDPLEAYEFRQQAWRRQFVLKATARWQFGTRSTALVRGEILRLEGGKGAVAAFHTVCCRAQFGLSEPPFCMRCRTVLPAFAHTTNFYGTTEGIAVDKIEHNILAFNPRAFPDPLFLTLLAAKLQAELLHALEAAPLKNNVRLPAL